MHYANICKRDIKAEQSASLTASLVSQWRGTPLTPDKKLCLLHNQQTTDAIKEEHAEKKQAKEPHSTKEDDYGVIIGANTSDSSVSTSNTAPSSTVLNTSRSYN